MRTPDVELLWWEGCPSTERALAELQGALAELGLADADVRMREIRTDDEARDAGFLGSPTILIDGVDLVTQVTEAGDAGPAAGAARRRGELERAGEQEEPGLNCRVYHRPGGRISPTPDPDDVREALRRAAARVEVS